MIDGEEMSVLDIMNPPGMFRDGVRAQKWTTKNLLPMSGKLIPEFDRRRNIRDMFSRKPSLLTSQSSSEPLPKDSTFDESLQPVSASSESVVEHSKEVASAVQAPAVPPATPPAKGSSPAKRSQKEPSLPEAKRSKSASQSSNTSDINKGQKSLKGFFAPKAASKPPPQSDGLDGTGDSKVTPSAAENDVVLDSAPALNGLATNIATASPTRSQQSSNDSFIDPIVAKETWGKLFVKPAAPKCEHEEPCKTMLTKKPGVNCGRSFWMCARPLGPSGNKEKGTQWRCSTFIWASDWNGAG